MDGRYFEEFSAGDRFATRAVTITESQIIDFALTFDPQPYHVDARAGAASPFGSLIASGFHTMSISFRMIMDSGVLNRNVGSPGMEDTRWLKPVRPGDSLHVEAEVVEARASKSRPGIGIVRIRYATINQDDETVLTMIITDFIRRRG